MAFLDHRETFGIAENVLVALGRLSLLDRLSFSGLRFDGLSLGGRFGRGFDRLGGLGGRFSGRFEGCGFSGDLDRRAFGGRFDLGRGVDRLAFDGGGFEGSGVAQNFVGRLFNRAVMRQQNLVGLLRLAGDAVIAAPTFFRAATAATAATTRAFLLVLLAMGARFLFEQGDPVGVGNLVVIRMDFAESEKTVAIAAIFDEGGLQRGFDPRDFRQIDVSAQLLFRGGLEIEFLDSISPEHHHPRLFGVGCVDQHFVGHCELLNPWRCTGEPLALRGGVRLEA